MADVDEIVNGFTQANGKSSYAARAFGHTVHFTAKNGMVTLIYDTREDRFAIKFHKLHAAWGDYIKAIARALYTVLNALKAAGLPFEAPQTLEGAVITATTGGDGAVYVHWHGPNVHWQGLPPLPPMDPLSEAALIVGGGLPNIV